MGWKKTPRETRILNIIWFFIGVNFALSTKRSGSLPPVEGGGGTGTGPIPCVSLGDFRICHTEGKSESIPVNFDSAAQTKDIAPGPDLIHKTMLKNLSTQCLKSLLKFYNHSWTSHNVPEGWKQAVVIPVLKPEKERNNPLHFRPIAVTSYLCKLYERMVNKCLVWFPVHFSSTFH